MSRLRTITGRSGREKSSKVYLMYTLDKLLAWICFTDLYKIDLFLLIAKVWFYLTNSFTEIRVVSVESMVVEYT